MSSRRGGGSSAVCYLFRPVFDRKSGSIYTYRLSERSPAAGTWQARALSVLSPSLCQKGAASLLAAGQRRGLYSCKPSLCIISPDLLRHSPALSESGGCHPLLSQILGRSRAARDVRSLSPTARRSASLARRAGTAPRPSAIARQSAVHTETLCNCMHPAAAGANAPCGQPFPRYVLRGGARCRGAGWAARVRAHDLLCVRVSLRCFITSKDARAAHTPTLPPHRERVQPFALTLGYRPRSHALDKQCNTYATVTLRRHTLTQAR